MLIGSRELIRRRSVGQSFNYFQKAQELDLFFEHFKVFVVFFCSLRLCSSLRKEFMSSCLRIVWHMAAVWISSSSPASTWTWRPWRMCPRTPEAPSTSTTTSRYNIQQANLFADLSVHTNTNNTKRLQGSEQYGSFLSCHFTEK